jgi:hypothetical protein
MTEAERKELLNEIAEEMGMKNIHTMATTQQDALIQMYLMRKEKTSTLISHSIYPQPHGTLVLKVPP